jgi:hypothetical protein
MTFVIAFMVILLTGYQVAAQPHLEARTSAMILDANGNPATLGKKNRARRIGLARWLVV